MWLLARPAETLQWSKLETTDAIERHAATMFFYQKSAAAAKCVSISNLAFVLSCCFALGVVLTSRVVDCACVQGVQVVRTRADAAGELPSHFPRARSLLNATDRALA